MRISVAADERTGVAEAGGLRARNEPQVVLLLRVPLLIGGAQGEHADLVLAAEFLQESGEHETEAVDRRKRRLDCADEDSHRLVGSAGRREGEKAPESRRVPALNGEPQEIDVAAVVEPVSPILRSAGSSAVIAVSTRPSSAGSSSTPSAPSSSPRDACRATYTLRGS